MENKLISKALGGLAEDPTDRDILDRIAEMREALGDEDVEDLSERELIRRGEHERVSIDAEGGHVSLYFPIKSGDETIETLLIRRPTAKQLKKMEDAKGGGIGRSLVLLAEATGRAVAELDRLDAADTNLCCTVLGFLQRPPRRTGARS